MEQLRILFLAADPGSTGRVNAGREAREIRERLRAAEHRDAIELVERFAVRPGDLQQTFFEVRPHVVHFSGHGTEGEELVLEGDDGGAEPLGKRALTDLFRVHNDTVRLVVLSACHSRPQVEAISEHVECAIGMRRAIGARAATEFSAALYLAIGFGASVAMAFESAVAELRARGIPEDHTPQLVVRPGVDAARVMLLGATATAPAEVTAFCMLRPHSGSVCGTPSWPRSSTTRGSPSGGRGSPPRGPARRGGRRPPAGEGDDPPGVPWLLRFCATGCTHRPPRRKGLRALRRRGSSPSRQPPAATAVRNARYLQPAGSVVARTVLIGSP